MLNFIHANSQTSLRVGTSLRSNPFLITFVDCFGATKVAPRNDASLVFENGKFLQSYGKGLGGTPITIGYDSKNQQYFGFTNKGSSNSGSIYDAISASSNGKYSADILRGVVQPIPVADTTPSKPPSQPTPQPKPLSQSELSAAQFLVDTLTADKRQLEAKENEYHRNILQIAKQNMHDSAVRKFARDAALMQQAYAIGGEMGSIPRLVAPMEGRKTTADTDRNISEYFDNPNNKYSNNELVKLAAQVGETVELAGNNFAWMISHLEGGQETLAALGVGFDAIKYLAKGTAKIVLPKDVYNSIAQHYNELPRGVQISLETALFSAMPVGTVVKIAGKTIGKMPLTDVPALLAAKPIPKDPLSLVKSKYYNSPKPLLAIEGGVGEVGKISTALGENTLTKPVPLEIKPIASSMLTKVDDFGLAESGIHGKIEAAIGNKPIVTGSLRELTALEIKLACEELGASGVGKPMAGAGSTVPIKDINRLVATYGGFPQDWAKMFSKDRVLKEGVVLLPDTNVQLHYYKNIKTGQVVEIKPVIATKK